MDQNSKQIQAQPQVQDPTYDRISLLPDEILHKILSLLLKDKSAARTSSLSKRWQALWRSFPIIDLIEDYIFNFNRAPFADDYIAQCRDRFIEWIELALLHRSMENLKKLQINTLFPGNEKLHFLVDKLVDRAIRGGLQHLFLEFNNRTHLISSTSSSTSSTSKFEQNESCAFCYKLPEVIFSLGSKFLVSLTVEGCSFESFSGGALDLQFLKTLYMENVHISEHSLHTLISGCPVVRSLTLRRCHGLKFIHIQHNKIRHLVLQCWDEMKGFNIDILSLQSFKFKGSYENDFELNSSSEIQHCCLKTLKISRARMRAETLNHLVSNFPTLATMKLKNCSIIERFQLVSGDKIRNLTVINCCFEDQVDFTNAAGALIFLKYVDNLYGSVWIQTEFKFLQHLIIIGNSVKIKGMALRFTVENSPLLKYLKLQSCAGLKEIGFISHNLEILVVDECFDVKRIRIFARKLAFLKYVGPVLKFSRVVLSSYELTAELHLKEHYHNRNHIHNNLKLVKLTNFLQIFSTFTKSMTLIFDCPKVCTYICLKT